MNSSFLKKSVEEHIESIWATLDRSVAEGAKRQAEYDAAAEKRNAEYAAAAEKRQAEYDAAHQKRQAEYDAAHQKRRAEFEADLKRWQAESEKRQAEAEKRQTELDLSLKKLNDLVGGHMSNAGKIAEDFFFNALNEEKRNIFGEDFDHVVRNARGIEKGYEDEYDILLINGKAVSIVEVKYKAHDTDLDKILRKAETFRVNYPKYQNHKVYICIASMGYYPELEEECKKKGIAIIKQVGKVIVISDENLKEY